MNIDMAQIWAVGAGVSSRPDSPATFWPETVQPGANALKYRGMRLTRATRIPIFQVCWYMQIISDFFC